MKFVYSIFIVYLSTTLKAEEQIEQPPYQVLRVERDYELRSYPASKWVQTQMKNAGKYAVTTPLFMDLFDYIAGQNEEKAKIEMTAPVLTLVEPGQSPNCQRQLTMAFYIPAAHQDAPPAPSHANVTIAQHPPMKVFVRTFGGYSDPEKVAAEHSNLLKSLNDEDKKKIQSDGPFYEAGYDAPYKRFDRRNEIWGALRRDTVASQNEPNIEPLHGIII